MVVGGLPEKNNIHAECVANQALDMMHYCRQVKRPDNGENIVVSLGEGERDGLGWISDVYTVQWRKTRNVEYEWAGADFSTW